MNTHRRHALSLSLMLLLTVLLADTQTLAAESLTGNDRSAIREIIEAQIDAFQADDGETAFSYASPGIQAQFGSAANFMVMVKSGYPAVYRPRQVVFQETLEGSGQVAQKVLFVDQNNRSVQAIYPMQKQPDGSWRIDGCYLTEANSKPL